MSIHLADSESRELTLAPGAASAPAQPVVAANAAPPAPATESRRVKGPALSTPPGVEVRSDSAGSKAPWRTLGYASLGLGELGLGAGVVGGLLTLDAKNAADAACTNRCTGPGLDAEARGKTWSAVSTMGFAIAGAGLAAGAAMLWLAPSRRVSGGLTVRPGLAGTQLRWVGEF
jgi:hypothetical protein